MSFSYQKMIYLTKSPFCLINCNYFQSSVVSPFLTPNNNLVIVLKCTSNDFMIMYLTFSIIQVTCMLIGCDIFFLSTKYILYVIKFVQLQSSLKLRLHKRF